MALVSATVASILTLGSQGSTAWAADSADASWGQALLHEIQEQRSPFGVELSLSGSPFESAVRIPVLPHTDLPVGSITPYLSAGVTNPAGTVGEAYVLPRREIETNRASQRMDVGAGLNWFLTDRIQLFGEMGLQKSRQQPYSLIGADPGRRDFEGTYVKGGITIRVP
jgi:hypothetical protein